MKYISILMSMMFFVGNICGADQSNGLFAGLSADQITKINKDKIQIFGYPECRYCQTVASLVFGQSIMRESNKIEFIDSMQPENKALLKAISGKTQVPYLVDSSSNVKMAESKDIIAYLMKKFGITYAPVVTVTQAVQEEQTQKSYNPATFMSDIAQSTKPVVILVSTTWCPPCKILKPIFLQVAQQFAQDCTFICVDGDANYEILQQLEISYYPSVVCFNKGQKIVPENYRSQSDLTDVITKLLQ